MGGGVTSAGKGGGRGSRGKSEGEGGEGEGDGEGGRGELAAARGLGGVSSEPFMVSIKNLTKRKIQEQVKCSTWPPLVWTQREKNVPDVSKTASNRSEYGQSQENAYISNMAVF